MGRWMAAMSAFTTMLTNRAIGAGPGAPAIHVMDSWARATPTGADAAGPLDAPVFLTIFNSGDGPERMLGGSCPLANLVSFAAPLAAGHGPEEQELKGVDLAPGERLAMQPGRVHLVLAGLARPLRAGERIPLTLAFEFSEPLALEVPVLATNAPAPGLQ